MTSLLKIAEQIRSILGGGYVQEYSEAVKQAYSLVAKKQWYENKNDGISEINGSFIYTFKGIPIKQDKDTDVYYIDIPSSYVELPHEEGVNFVGYAKGLDAPFVRMSVSSSALYSGLKSSVMGGNKTYSIEGSTIQFPNMTKFDYITNDKIMLRMAISLDTVDVDQELNISPLFAGEIVDMVVSRYSQKDKNNIEKL